MPAHEVRHDPRRDVATGVSDLPAVDLLGWPASAFGRVKKTRRSWCYATNWPSCGVTSPCTAPEVDRSVLTWDFDPLPCSGSIADLVPSAVVLDHGSPVRLARDPGPDRRGGHR